MNNTDFETEAERMEREAFEAGNFETLPDSDAVEFEDGESEVATDPDAEHARFMFDRY